MASSLRTFFLTTARLGFSTWSDEDLDLAVSLWGDAEVTAWIGGPFSEAAIRARLTREQENQRAQRIQYWPVFMLDTGELAGCTGLRPYPGTENVLELGAHFFPAFWGKGFAREATEAAIAYAFSTIGATALMAAHHPRNLASAALIGRLGFRFSHEAVYEPTGLIHPYYRLDQP